MKRIQIIVSGKVQAVFYRNYIKQQCDKLGIKGYTFNNANSTVKIVADVDEEQEKALTKACWRGSMTSFVKNVEVTPSEHEEEFNGFDIR